MANRAYVCDFKCGEAFEDIAHKRHHQAVNCPNSPRDGNGHKPVMTATVLPPVPRMRKFTSSPALQARGLLIIR